MENLQPKLTGNRNKRIHQICWHVDYNTPHTQILFIVNSITGFFRPSAIGYVPDTITCWYVGVCECVRVSKPARLGALTGRQEYPSLNFL